MEKEEKELYYDWGTPAYLQQEDKKGFDIWRESALTMRHPNKDKLWGEFYKNYSIKTRQETWDILFHGYYTLFYRPLLRYKKVVLLYKYLSSTLVLLLPRDLYPIIARFLIY